MLELYQYENCPYCRLVREKLYELGVDYIIRNVAPGTPKNDLLVEVGGKRQVPLLVDKEKEIVMYESGDIVKYLEGEYPR